MKTQSVDHRRLLGGYECLNQIQKLKKVHKASALVNGLVTVYDAGQPDGADSDFEILSCLEKMGQRNDTETFLDGILRAYGSPPGAPNSGGGSNIYEYMLHIQQLGKIDETKIFLKALVSSFREEDESGISGVARHNRESDRNSTGAGNDAKARGNGISLEGNAMTGSDSGPEQEPNDTVLGEREEKPGSNTDDAKEKSSLGSSQRFGPLKYYGINSADASTKASAKLTMEKTSFRARHGMVRPKEELGVCNSSRTGCLTLLTSHSYSSSKMRATTRAMKEIRRSTLSQKARQDQLLGRNKFQSLTRQLMLSSWLGIRRLLRHSDRGRSLQTCHRMPREHFHLHTNSKNWTYGHLAQLGS